MTSPGERLACPPAAIPGLDVVPTVAVSVLICRKTAILDRVLVEDVLRDSVRRPLKPRLVVCDRSRRHRPGSLGAVDDLLDVVGFQTDSDHDARAEVGTPPPTPTTPELQPDAKLIVPHATNRRSGVAAARPLEPELDPLPITRPEPARRSVGWRPRLSTAPARVRPACGDPAP